MQTAGSRAVAATRKAIVANGVPAHLTTYFGTNFAMRGPDAPPPPGPEVVYPMAFLVEQSAGSTVQAHFHAANQFQVVVAGRGMLGRHEVAPICVHYTNVHRPGRRARRHPRLVRAPLGDRDHIPRGPAAPRRGDAAPVVRPGHRAHHARAARPLLPRDPVGARATPLARAAAAFDRRLVREGARHVRRRARQRAPRALSRGGFAHVPATVRPRRSAAPAAQAPDGARLLCGVKAQSRAKIVTVAPPPRE